MWLATDDFGLNKVLAEPNCELPNNDAGGGSTGVNEAIEDGGGPAGVVEGKALKMLETLPSFRLEPGVEGAAGLEENGTEKPDMVKILGIRVREGG